MKYGNRSSMSRIGKKPIAIPSGVEVKLTGRTIEVKGPRGVLQKEIRPEILVSVEGGAVTVIPQKKTKKTPALWGLTRSLIANMVDGVTNGFEKKLELQGIGYKVTMEGGSLVFRVGFSHTVTAPAPSGITFVVEKNIITVVGANKELVGQTAANIRAIKKPEPYKGKGIRYVGEVVRKKAGKKAAAGA